jgi:gliding motility-associated-like protein
MNRSGSNQYLYCLAVLITLLLSASALFAQVTADFTADKTGGCSPLTTSFTNTTRGASGNAVYVWDLGNGNMSVNRNASATYVAEKTYTVTLTVTDGSRTSSKSMQVVVSRKPVADFVISAPSGCIPFTPQFTSRSTTADGTLTNFVWEYGDGFADRVSSPVVAHTYTTPATPTVTLTVINNYGCAATVQKQAVTEVLPALTAGFTADKNILCTIQDAATFTNTSTGPATLSYLWNFGDNKTLTTRNASHTYDQAGEYTVSLTTSNNKGCSQTYTYPARINVAAYKLDVTVPALLCSALQNYSFTASTYPAGYYAQWVFSDNTTYPFTNYVSKYSLAAGDYSVKVKATIGTCPVEVNKTFKVFASPTLPVFDAIVPKCGAPATVVYKDVSTWAVKWEWRFYDNNSYYNYTTATEKEPTKLYNSDGSYYNTTLTATDANGCTAATSKVQSINRASVSIIPFNSTATAGNSSITSCAGFSSSFKASINTGSITAYQWNLGGNTSTNAEASATFSAQGSYPVSLSYTTDLGCTGTAGVTAVVRSGPAVDFSGTTSVCGDRQTSFSRTGTAAARDEHYWSIFNSKGEALPSHNAFPYSTSFSYVFPDTGLYSVQLTVVNTNSNIYCSNTVTKNDYIRVLPPFLGNSIRVTNNCTDNKGLLTFKDTCRYVEEWEWDFGDGEKMKYTKVNRPAEVTHVYKNTNRYNVTLTVTSGSCSFTTSAQAIVLLDPVISFTGASTVCGNRYADFNNTGSTVVSSYLWNYTDNRGNNLTSSGASTTRDFPDTGYFDVKLTLLVNNCKYEGAYQPDFIRVLAPYPGNITSQNTCNEQRGEVIFTESSRGTEKWDWNFGDGGTMSYTLANKPAAVNHAYKASGKYTVSLTVTTGGCSFQMYRNLGQVSVLLKQKPVLSAIQTAVCVDKDLDITLNGFELNPRADYPTYSHYNIPRIEYEDQSVFTGTQTNTVAQNAPDWYYRGKWQTEYTASLSNLSRDKQQIRMIIAPYGFSEYADCPDTSNYVTMRIDGPTTVLKVLKNNVCYNEPVVFEDLSTVPAGNSIVNRQWSFGDGQVQTGVDAKNPVLHTYSNVSSYPVSLKVTDNMGCTATSNVTAVVQGPKASFTLSPTPATNKNTVYVYNNSLYIGNTPQYKWRFSYDGLQTTATNPDPRTYKKGGPATDTVRLIAYNSTTGCADTLTQLLPVVNVNNAFTMNSSFLDGGCLPVLVRFNNISYNYNSFVWDFGDGTKLEDPTNSIRTPGHIYQQPGTYKVILYGTGIGNSKDTTIDSVIIKPLAFAGNVQSNIQETCASQAVDLTATVQHAASITWDYGDGVLGTTTQPKSTYIYTTGGIYKPAIVVKNSDGCATAASLNTTILIDSLNITLQPQPAKICDSAVVNFNPVVRNLGADRLGRSLQYSWNFGTTGTGNTSTAANPAFKYNKTGLYTASLRVKSQAGCDKTASAIIKVITTPVISVTAVDEVCAKNTVSFQGNATPSAGVTWRWDFNNGTTAVVQHPDPVTYNTPGNYIVKFVADNEGCARTAEHPLVVHSLPVVNPMHDTVIVIGNTVPLQATGSSDIIRWSWSPATYLDCASCASTTSLPRKHIRYEVTGYNQYGCTATASAGIRLICAETPLFIPNTFTPNKDGRNDLFYPRGKGVQLVKFFRIYNRLGEMIFERKNFALNDPAQGWDGTYLGKPLSAGVFTYSSDMICDAGETFSLKGTIMLIH